MVKKVRYNFSSKDTDIESLKENEQQWGTDRLTILDHRHEIIIVQHKSVNTFTLCKPSNINIPFLIDILWHSFIASTN